MNLGIFDDVATDSMTPGFPSRNDLIAVGEQVSERVEGAQSGIGADVYVISVEVSLPQKPRRVFINAHQDVLTR